MPSPTIATWEERERGSEGGRERVREGGRERERERGREREREEREKLLKSAY